MDESTVKKSSMTRDEGRAFGREQVAKNLLEHRQRTGDTRSTFEDCKRHVNKIADHADAKKDR